MNKSKNCSEVHRAGPGASTVLMILLVMCLALLGALSLSVARNDLAITRRAMTAEADYYRAQSLMARRLAAVDAILALGGDSADLAGVQPSSGLVTFDVPVDDHRILRTTLRIVEGDASKRYEIIENRICVSE